MSELSIFVDESGDFGLVSPYYLVTFIFHNQEDPLSVSLERYETALRNHSLPNIPFHMNPLLRGNKNYENLSFSSRQQLLASFLIMSQHLPFSYLTLSYRKSDFVSLESMFVRLRRDFTNLLFENLSFFQEYEKVKVYYDDGQDAVSKSIHSGIEYVLAKDAYLFRNANPSDYRLSQIADFVCGIELAAIKYAASQETATDKGFFGNSQSFKKNYLSKVRKHRLG